MTQVLRNNAFVKAGGTRGLFFAAVIITGPALLFWHLHGLWNPYGDYAYGWVVPLLALFLFKVRWDDCPAPSASAGGAVPLAGFFALLALPALWLQEAAPERSICGWSYATACVGISLCLISLAGGGAWLRWFCFPFFFIFTAVPWPHTLETLISNSLMHDTAGATVEILCLAGIPSMQAGNLVHIETGVIDIDEACSGIRSLQAMVMLSLFLGELFRLRPARRVLLIVLGLSVTLLANVARTVVLSSIGFRQGIGAVDQYHDAAGFIVLALSLSCTVLAALKLRAAKTAPPVPAPVPDSPAIELVLPFKLSLALLCWFFFVEISVESWYRLREPKWQGWSWAVQWPQQREAFQFTAIPKNSLRLLMCDESHAASWKEPDGGDWTLYWIRWNPGNPAAETAKVHRPDVCLNAAGAIMERDLGAHLTTVGDRQVLFHSYTFLTGEKRLHVFFCLYEEKPGDPAEASAPQFEKVDMVERAFKGWRHIGLQSLEVAVSGYPTERDAQEAFKARIGQLMQVK